jgi:hypothetical protein
MRTSRRPLLLNAVLLLGTFVLLISMNTSPPRVDMASTLVSKPAMLPLPPDLYRTLHLGKAGGGTVKQRFKKIWHLDATQCHPDPCFSNSTKTSKTESSSNLTQTEMPLVFVTLRDPVDRFVSAFYWRIFRLCEVSGLSLAECVRPPATAKHQKLIKLMFDRYEQSASRLAEDLCTDNLKTATAARRAVEQIPHAQHSIHDWMAYTWQPERVYPLVMEPEARALEDQFDSAVVWLYETQPFESEADFSKRRAYVAEHTFPSTNRHSSKDNKQALSPAAEACLEQYYQPDYELLRTVQATTCKSDDCRQAIQLILNRRSGAWKDTVQ